MNHAERVRSAIRDAARSLEPDTGRHLSEDEWIAYYRGVLDESTTETAQTHLVCCTKCQKVFLDVRDLCGSEWEAEEAPDTATMDRTWRAFSRQLEGDAGSTMGLWRRLREMFMPVPALALAGMAAISIGLTIWGVSQWRTSRTVIGQLEVVQREQNIDRERLARRLSELEAENRRLQSAGTSMPQRTIELEKQIRSLREQIETDRRQYETQVAELRKPELNFPIYQLRPVVRGSTPPSVAERKVPSTAQRFALILSGEGLPKHEEYDIVVVNNSREIVWSSQGLRRSPDGTFVLMFDRGFMPAGEYRIQVYPRNDRSTILIEYPLRLSY